MAAAASAMRNCTSTTSYGEVNSPYPGGVTEATSPHEQRAETPGSGGPKLGRAIAVYGLARLLIIAAVAGILTLVKVPLLVAIMVALVVAVPASMLLLKRPSTDLNVALARAGARRRAQKAELLAQLRGEEEPAGSELGERQADSAAERPEEHDQPGGTEGGDEVPTDGPADHPTNR